MEWFYCLPLKRVRCRERDREESIANLRKQWQLGATIDFSKDCYTRQENFLGAELSSVTNIIHLRYVEIVDLFMTSLLVLRHSNVLNANLLSIERHQWRKKHSDSVF